MKRIILLTIAALLLCTTAQAVDLTRATIVYHGADAPLVKQMAQVLADDIERVSGVRPPISKKRLSKSIASMRITSCTDGRRCTRW